MRGLDPRIHLLRKSSLQRLMDCRVKPGNDELEFVAMRFRGGRADLAKTRHEHQRGASSAACSSAASMCANGPDGWSRPMRARQSRSSPEGADAKNPRAKR